MNHVLLFLLFIVFALSATSLYVIGNLFKKYKFLYFKYIIFLLLNGSILIIFEFIQIYTTINLKDLINYQIFLKIMANLILIPESLFLIIFPVFTLRIIKKNIKKRKQLIFLWNIESSGCL